ncbi:unnamed protein product [Gulo gulo]|uniref:Uncharacterized protein n=1 Tax=Gulo gulo TaxID=48420 RepID=A0A9X9LYW8_GULGU|nr:unnamed protein product [Gulo gulo]
MSHPPNLSHPSSLSLVSTKLMEWKHSSFLLGQLQHTPEFLPPNCNHHL